MSRARKRPVHPGRPMVAERPCYRQARAGVASEYTGVRPKNDAQRHRRLQANDCPAIFVHPVPNRRADFCGWIEHRDMASVLTPDNWFWPHYEDPRADAGRRARLWRRPDLNEEIGDNVLRRAERLDFDATRAKPQTVISRLVSQVRDNRRDQTVCRKCPANWLCRRLRRGGSCRSGAAHSCRARHRTRSIASPAPQA